MVNRFKTWVIYGTFQCPNFIDYVAHCARIKFCMSFHRFLICTKYLMEQRRNCIVVTSKFPWASAVWASFPAQNVGPNTATPGAEGNCANRIADLEITARFARNVVIGGMNTAGLVLLDRMTLSLPSSKCTFSQPFSQPCISEVVRISSLIIFHLSKLWQAKLQYRSYCGLM